MASMLIHKSKVRPNYLEQFQWEIKWQIPTRIDVPGKKCFLYYSDVFGGFASTTGDYVGFALSSLHWCDLH